METLSTIPDRERFLKVASQRLERAVADRKPLSVVFVLIDNFRECGGAAANICLRGVSDAIHANADHRDCMVWRMRDHEFAIVCNGETGENAEQMAEQIRKDVASLQLQPTADGGPLTVSCSVTTRTSRARGRIEALLINADRALREAVRLGGNMVIAR